MENYNKILNFIIDNNLYNENITKNIEVETMIVDDEFYLIVNQRLEGKFSMGNIRHYNYKKMSDKKRQEYQKIQNYYNIEHKSNDKNQKTTIDKEYNNNGKKSKIYIKYDFSIDKIKKYDKFRNLNINKEIVEKKINPDYNIFDRYSNELIKLIKNNNKLQNKETEQDLVFKLIENVSIEATILYINNNYYCIINEKEKGMNDIKNYEITKDGKLKPLNFYIDYDIKDIVNDTVFDLNDYKDYISEIIKKEEKKVKEERNKAILYKLKEKLKELHLKIKKTKQSLDSKMLFSFKKIKNLAKYTKLKLEYSLIEKDFKKIIENKYNEKHYLEILKKYGLESVFKDTNDLIQKKKKAKIAAKYNKPLSH